jgi:DNA-binding IclR family transcriptional regulator
MRIIDRVRVELDVEFQSTAEIAARCGLTPSTVAAPLGTLRRNGEAEYLATRPGRRSLWRTPSIRDPVSG